MAFTLLKATMTQQLCVGSTLARATWGFDSDIVQEVLSRVPCFYPVLGSKLPCLCGNLSFVLQIRHYSLNAHTSCFCWMSAMHWLVGTGFAAMLRAWLCWMSHSCRTQTGVLRNNSWQQRDSSEPYLAVCVLKRTGCQGKGHRCAKENLLVLHLKLDKSSPTLIFFLWRVCHSKTKAL